MNKEFFLDDIYVTKKYVDEYYYSIYRKDISSQFDISNYFDIKETTIERRKRIVNKLLKEN